MRTFPDTSTSGALPEVVFYSSLPFLFFLSLPFDLFPLLKHLHHPTSSCFSHPAIQTPAYPSCSFNITASVSPFLTHSGKINAHAGLPGGPVAKTALAMQSSTWVQSLVGEPDPRSHITTKTWHSQINKYLKKKIINPHTFPAPLTCGIYASPHPWPPLLTTLCHQEHKQLEGQACIFTFITLASRTAILTQKRLVKGNRWYQTCNGHTLNAG